MVTGITFSAFDLLHAGHLTMLEEASSHCDYLIAGLHADPSKERGHKNQPVQSLTERFLQLRAVRWVDEIIVYETEEDVMTLLRSLPIDVRFIGEEYKDLTYTGSGLPIRVHYNARSHSWSSSDLRKRVVEAEKMKEGN